MLSVSELRVELYNVKRFKLFVLQGSIDNFSHFFGMHTVVNARSCRRDVTGIKGVNVERDVYRDFLVFVDEVDCLLGAEVLDPEFRNCIAFEIVDVADANVNQTIKAEEL